jgi:prepilin-type processing-associated H-X9-DG protein
VTGQTNRYYQFNHGFYDYQHSEGGNLLYCDGHAKFKKKTAIRFLDFGADMSAQPNPNLTFADVTNGCNPTTCAQNNLQLNAAF